MKSVVIDNFLEDPHRVIEFAKTLKYRKRDDKEYWEGMRTDDLKTIDMDFFQYLSQQILYSYYDTHNSYAFAGTMHFHILKESDLEDPQWKHIENRIHYDECLVSAIVYLTPDAPMDNGTQIYRMVDGKFVPDIIYHNKFNRLVMFPGSVHHSAINIAGGKEDRLTLLFFIDNIQLDNR
jgi:hypothetical protein